MNLNDLPFARKNKYGAIKVQIDGMQFDSKKEAKRYYTLLQLQKLGLVKDIKRQVKFDISINKIHICNWFADFVYEEKTKESKWKPIVEDVKSEITRKNSTYRLKKKLVEATYRLTINEA